jgi:hypothetical protein
VIAALREPIGAGTAAGYLHPSYAESFAEFGTPRELPRSGGWILERAVRGFPYRDAMGCYPLFSCRDWSMLPRDLEDIGQGLVALVVVTDPFGAYDVSTLTACFDRVTPYKPHSVVDLSGGEYRIPSKHHRYYAKRAAASVEVELCPDPRRLLDDWERLYAGLVRRRGISGLRAGSRAVFERQMAVPGIVMFRALHRGELVGLHWWYVQGDVAFSHLAATSDRGYGVLAAYALHGFAIAWFAGKVRWLNLGGAAGTVARAGDGLDRFKRGWATATRTTYLCGRVFNEAAYRELAPARGREDAYFPAYRAGD